MKTTVVHVLLVLMLCSLVLVLPATAAVNGKIVFTSTRDGNSEIYVMNADGTGQTRLTNNPASDSAPAWSPDGKKIAFISDRDGNSEIYVMNADGSEQTRLTKYPQVCYEPTWSPDGKKIAFIMEDGNNMWGGPYYNIYVMNSDGTGRTQLTTDPANYGSLKWSPDGKKIAFEWQQGPSFDEVVVMNVDGSGDICLRCNDLVNNGYPAWSPDGKEIAFSSDFESFYFNNLGWSNTEIYVSNVDGTGLTRLSKTSVINQIVSTNSPAWSPDGKKIAFVSERDGNSKIYIMNADGSNPTLLASGSNPAWSPDGKKIAFDNGGIYVVNADGSNPTYLASGSNPAWVPAITLITVTFPNGGETWKRGTSQTITWSYTGNPGSTVKIVLSKGSLVGTIADNVPIGIGGKGSYTWAISSSGYTGSDYMISVQSTSQPTVKDTSNNYFTIIPATTAPSITVMSPNGGERWYKYTTHTITWAYTGNPGTTIKIVILKGGTPVDTIATNAPIGSNGKGSYSWWIKTSYPSGSDYKVSVQSTSQPTIKDTSNTNFGISWP